MGGRQAAHWLVSGTDSGVLVGSANTGDVITRPSEPPPRPPHNGEVQRYPGTGIPLPFQASQLLPTTISLKLQGDVYVQVYGGAPLDRTDPGEIGVTRVNGATGDELGDDGFTGIAVAPNGVGTITLTKVVHGTAFFEYEGGTGTFDLMSGTFQID